jgi:hypothetical protein
MRSLGLNRLLRSILFLGIACLCVASAVDQESQEPYGRDSEQGSSTSQVDAFDRDNFGHGSEKELLSATGDESGKDWKEAVRNVFKKVPTQEDVEGGGEDTNTASKRASSDEASDVQDPASARTGTSNPQNLGNKPPAAEAPSGSALKRQVAGSRAQDEASEDQTQQSELKDSGDGLQKSDSPKALSSRVEVEKASAAKEPRASESKRTPRDAGEADADSKDENSDGKTTLQYAKTTGDKSSVVDKKHDEAAANDAKGAGNGQGEDATQIEYSLKLKKGPACLNAPIQVK